MTEGSISIGEILLLVCSIKKRPMKEAVEWRVDIMSVRHMTAHRVCSLWGTDLRKSCFLMAVAIVTGRKSLVRTNGALGRCLCYFGTGLTWCLRNWQKRRSASSSDRVEFKLIYLLTQQHESQLQEQRNIHEWQLKMKK